MADPTHDTATPLAPPPRRTRSPAGGLALLLALIALVATGYLWYALAYQTHTLGAPLGRRLQSEQSALTALKARFARLAGSERATAKALRALARRPAARIAAHGQRFRIRAAQDLLLMANDELLFQHDVPLALLALHKADDQIRRAGDPRLLPVRSAIARETLKLKALRRWRVSTRALSLVALAHAVRHWPLVVATTFHPAVVRAQPAPEPFWHRAVFGVWHDFLALIRIRKASHNERALLSPKREAFVRANTTLRLYTAEYALLEYRPAVMRANLLATERWIGRYFDTKTPAVKAAQAEIARLVAHGLPRVPDISGSLHLLQRLTHA